MISLAKAKGFLILLIDGLKPPPLNINSVQMQNTSINPALIPGLRQFLPEKFHRGKSPAGFHDSL